MCVFWCIRQQQVCCHKCMSVLMPLQTLIPALLERWKSTETRELLICLSQESCWCDVWLNDVMISETARSQVALLLKVTEFQRNRTKCKPFFLRMMPLLQGTAGLWSLLEQVQQRATKMVKWLFYLSHEEKWRQLGLSGLQRRRRGDLACKRETDSGESSHQVFKYIDSA